MGKWTEKDILSLSPDESSTKNAKNLLGFSKWKNLGYNKRSLWGECQGSGSKPYLTQIDLQETSFKCSCPSRKFPCKHGLALFLLYANNEKNFSEKNPPSWVSDWIDKKESREKKKSEPSKKSVDEKAQAKRVEQREAKVKTGINEVELWIKDLIRNGLNSLPEKQNEFWRSISQKTIDAQAPGLSNFLTKLGNINYASDSWQTELLESLCKIHLIVQGFKNIETLPKGLQSDIQTLIGWTLKQEDLKAASGISDEWLVLGRQQEIEQDLTVQYNWLFGENSKQYALVLNFAYKNQPIDLNLVPGTKLKAELVYFPSNYPMRAVLKEVKETLEFRKVSGFQNWQEMLEHYSDALSHYPWITKLPILVQNLTPYLDVENRILVDQKKNFVKIANSFTAHWTVVACSGGKPLDFFLVYEGGFVTPLGVWIDDLYMVL
ncbi:MAG: SWIM zinc finger family protein [Leptospiraceae bacterium]|nr:SWIM zinc finger family protein [Leptospiraceae bacterium]